MQLAKSYEPAAVEAKWYPLWEERGYFRPEVADGGAVPFVMVIPPPNITGSLHMGHALNSTLQDVLARYHRMAGRRVLWLPGTDHAGIATQVVVERQLEGGAAERKAMGREAFERRVWQWREESGRTIVRQLRRLGVSCDWTRERFTLDAGLSRAVREVFVTLYEDGLIYRGDRLINWCVHCQTALSDLEVEYREQGGVLYHITYGPVVVATVRPESKLGDTGLAVHPEDERYRHLVGQTLTVETESGPLVLPVIADAAVDPTFGTGVVKVTPAHDPADWEMGQRHGLAVKSVIGTDGRMTADAGRYAGLDRVEARTRIVEDLRVAGLLEREEPYRHRVGVCYRCGNVVVPLISRQWFVKIAPLAAPALAAVRDGRTRFVPKQWENTYFAWLENIRDWCISRQLWWGHRIPAWTCCTCGETIVAREDPTACPKCGGPVEQDADVLDTWFSSALWPFSTLGWPERTDDVQRYYPTSVLITGFDIIFFWVARMMMMGLRFMGEVPFRDVYIHGLVRDPLGQKMSKSKGNVIDPLAMLDTYGTDALRIALAAFTGMWRDVKLAPQRIEGYRNFANKLWNAARFVLMNLEAAGPAAAATADALGRGERPADLALAERWIVSRLERTAGEVAEALEAYRFDDAASRLYQFAWRELCDWYVEAAKVPLGAGGGDADRSRGVLLYALERLLRLLHPFMPFLTEELWQAVVEVGWGKQRPERFAASIMIAPYPRPVAALLDEPGEAAMERLIGLVRAVRNLRSEFNLPPSQALGVQVFAPDAAVRTTLVAEAPLVRALARAEPLTVLDRATRPPRAAVETLDGLELYVPLDGLIEDVGAEIRRLERELVKIEGELRGVTAKLARPDFVEKAPEEIVEKERAKEAQLGERQSALGRNLERLRAMEA
jgi:valyl-tRNA synthetase